MPVSTATLAADLFPTDDLLETLLDISLTGINLLGPLYNSSGELEDFALQYLNPAAQHMTGLPERPGGTLCTHFPHARTDGILDFYRRVYETGETGHHDFRNRAGGLDNYFRSAARRKGQRLVVSFTDTSDQDRRPLEGALRESEAAGKAARAEAERQRGRFHEVFEQTPASIVLLRGPGHRVEYHNEAYQQLFPGRQMRGRTIAEIQPDTTKNGFVASLDGVYHTGETYFGREVQLNIDQPDGTHREIYFNFTYQACRENDQITGVSVFGYDVTEQVLARRLTEALQAEVLAAARRQMEERATSYQVFAQTPAALCIQRGPEHRYEYVNPAYQALFPDRRFVGRTVVEALPETLDGGIVPLLDRVYGTGEPFFGFEVPLTLQPTAAGEIARTEYYTFTYQAYRENGQIVGISTFAYNVTQQAMARQEREAQQRNLHALFEQAPNGICIFVGSDLVYEFHNPSYQALLPGRKLPGRPLLEVMPELKGTDAERLLRRVYETGETQQEHELPVPLARADGQELEERYFHIVYQARRDEQGQVNGILSFVVEVTGQARARKAIEESEARFRSLAENSPDVITRHGKDYRYLYASPRIEEVTGLKAEEFTGKSYRELGLPETFCTLLDEHLAYVFAHQTLHTPEYWVPGGKGYFLLRMVPECNQAAEVVSVLVLSTDITERKRAEAALRESEARFRLMADAVPQIVWITDPDGHTEFFNKQWTLYTGAPFEPITAAEVAASFVHPQDAALTMERFDSARQAGSAFSVEYRIRSLTGEYRWFLLKAEPYRDQETGQISRWFGASIDIDDRKRAEAALRDSEERLQKALSIETVGVIFFDLEGRINDANAAFESMSGYAKADLESGKVRWDELTPPEFMEATLKSRKELLTKGKNTPYQKQYMRPDGSRWWGLFSGKRLSETECVEFVLDITEGKGAEEALQQLYRQLAGVNADLSEANQLLTYINQDLDNFVYTASHDLKSPILNIEGLLKALQRQLSQKNPDQQEIGSIFGFLNESVSRFKATIADLTEVARISKESTEDIAPIDLKEMLEQVQLDLAPQIAEAIAQLDVKLDCPSIHFSRKNLKSILYNLLSNAVKYRSPDRTPLIHITCQPHGEYYCLTVEDNGLGMDMRQEEKIFALFKRLHAHVEGTGIGLYIVRKIIDNAGGKIEVESQVGVGSTFRVYFKLS